MRTNILLWSFAALLLCMDACDETVVEAGFEDLLDLTIYDFVSENDSAFSSFMAVLEAGGIDKTLSAYNPEGAGYTLFLPDNEAMDQFIQESDEFNSLDEMLQDPEYVRAFSRYHVVDMGIHSDDFPFGALPEYTLSGDLLTVSFIIESDTSYYKINNQAPVIQPNNEVSNGYVHVIQQALKPVTGTTFKWLLQHDGYSIFTEAVEATGLDSEMDIPVKEVEGASFFTLLLEHDSVFSRRGITSFGELVALISPDNNNYSHPSNPLYLYVAYHMLEGTMFIDDFVDVNTNYTTYSEIPININGGGLDILINPRKEVFDTLIVEGDTTIIDYVGFDYDNSNILTLSGSIHFIDQVLRQQPPSRATQTFEFWDEPLLNEFRKDPGDYLIEDTALLNNFTWSGTDLYFIETGDPDHSAWGGDYLYMDGDFIISYRIPKIVQGVYTVNLRVETLGATNALVEVFIDGKNIGGLVDLSAGGSSNNPFQTLELGAINLTRYSEHTVTIQSLIPGRFSWDLIQFEPYVKE